MLCMTSLLWNSTLTLLKHTWVVSILTGSLKYHAGLLLYSQLSCGHVPKRISWRNFMKHSFVLVKHFNVINSFRWCATYNYRAIHTIAYPLRRHSGPEAVVRTLRWLWSAFLQTVLPCHLPLPNHDECNVQFQNLTTRHRRLIPHYTSCPYYFILNLIISSWAINSISPQQIRSLQTIKGINCGHCCCDISINCSRYPTGTDDLTFSSSSWQALEYFFHYKRLSSPCQSNNEYMMSSINYLQHFPLI